MKLAAIGLDLEVTWLDLMALPVSYALVAIYILTKNWIYNNILAMAMCVNGIQLIFLGNF